MQRAARRPWGLFFFTALAVLAVLGALVCLALYTDPREARALKIRGALVAVTRGNEPLVLGANWQKLLLRIQPRWQSAIGGMVLEPMPGCKPSSLVAWQTLGDWSNLDGRGPSFRAMLSDERGEWMAVEGSSPWVIFGPPNLVPFEIETLPRRGRQIRIRPDGDTDKGLPSLELIVPNPTPESFPLWVPDPVPATRRMGDLEVTVDRFTVQTIKPERGGFFEAAALELRIRKKGRVAVKDWAVSSVTIDDPTGNTWWFTPYFHNRNGEGIKVYFGSLTIPREPAYRVRMDLVRVANRSDRRRFEFMVPITQRNADATP